MTVPQVNDFYRFNLTKMSRPGPNEYIHIYKQCHGMRLKNEQQKTLNWKRRLLAATRFLHITWTLPKPQGGDSTHFFFFSENVGIIYFRFCHVKLEPIDRGQDLLYPLTALLRNPTWVHFFSLVCVVVVGRIRCSENFLYSHLCSSILLFTHKHTHIYIQSN